MFNLFWEQEAGGGVCWLMWEHAVHFHARQGPGDRNEMRELLTRADVGVDVLLYKNTISAVYVISCLLPALPRSHLSPQHSGDCPVVLNVVVTLDNLLLHSLHERQRQLLTLAELWSMIHNSQISWSQLRWLTLPSSSASHFLLVSFFLRSLNICFGCFFKAVTRFNMSSKPNHFVSNQ